MDMIEAKQKSGALFDLPLDASCLTKGVFSISVAILQEVLLTYGNRWLLLLALR